MSRNRNRKELARRNANSFPDFAPDPGAGGPSLADLKMLLGMLRSIPLPSPYFIDDPKERAQALAIHAAEARAPDEAIRLAMEALELDDGCVKAHMILADHLSFSAEEFIRRAQTAVQAGTRALGALFFEEQRGRFWGHYESRTYMMAREALAYALRSSGRIEEEIREYEEMLELNPNDNQGVRYNLLGRYLQRDDLAGAHRLFDRYGSEGSGLFAWARVLERWVSSDTEGASTALDHAREVNPFVEPYLTGRKTPPAHLPEYIAIGDEDEAVVFMDEIGPAWTAHPDAIEWLKKAG
jgi:tetratricopeptide (TPR) repeat protein